MIMTLSLRFLILFLMLLTAPLSYGVEICSDNGNNWPSSKPAAGEPPLYFVLAMGANSGTEVKETSRLVKANKDAEDFVKVMQEYFQKTGVSAAVCLLTNVVSADFMEALRRLVELVRESDKVFIYFSGHGSRRPTCNKGEEGCNEEDCYDETFVASAGQVRDDDFVERVNQIKTERPVTILLDTCFSGGMVRGEKVTEDCLKNARAKTLESIPLIASGNCPVNNLTQLEHSILYAASQELQFAREYSAGGLFTQIWVKSMKTALLDTSSSELLSEAFWDRVFEVTKQQVSNQTGPKESNCYQEPIREQNK